MNHLPSLLVIVGALLTSGVSSAEDPPTPQGSWEACLFLTDPDLGFRGPAGIAIGADGSVVVADYDHDQLLEYAPDRTFIRAWGSDGTLDGQFQAIGSISCDQFGHVYVSDLIGCRIQRFTLAGTFVNGWGGCGDAPGEFGHLAGIAVDIQARVYGIDDVLNKVVVFQPTGDLIREWPIQLGKPSSIVITPDTTIVVASEFTHTIHAYSPSGAHLFTWGSTGTGVAQFRGHMALATDALGNIYVADEGNSRVQKFTPAGAPIASWPSINPRGIAVALPFARVLSAFCRVEDFAYAETPVRRASWGYIKTIYR